LYKINTWLLLSLFSLLLVLPGISKMPVIDRDEAHFAQASRQMVQTGNYFQIRFQDKTRFQKPPGINWLQAGSVKVFSNGDANAIWPYRIPSVLSALLSVLLTCFFARRFTSTRAAAIAAGLLASSLLFVVEAHMAVIDTALLSSVLLMEGSLWVIYQAGVEKRTVATAKIAHWGWALAFWLAMSYGMVLKGVTPLIGLLSILTLCVVDKRVDWLSGLRIYRGLLLFIGFNVTWLLLVNEAEQSNYLLQMLNKDLLPKLQGGHESHGKPPLFHLCILPLTFWPASLFLWSGGVYAWKNRAKPEVKFLLAWLLPAWIFFECMPTKLPQYVLPLFPALALLCAMAIENQFHGVKPGKWLRFLQILWGLLSIGLGVGIVLMGYLVMQELNYVSVSILFEIGILTFFALYYVRQGINQRALISVFIMAALTFYLVFAELLPQLKPLWLTTTITQLVEKYPTTNKKPLLVVGYEEPSLVFTLNTHRVSFASAGSAMSQLRDDPSRFALFEESALQNWTARPQNLTILAQVRGFNYSKGRWVKLILIGPKPSGESQDDAI
jgi:4-amino-4-deoxy-L-arabinose transferase-like glycosyltransferase